jgi:protein-S-isoprenylcysteine O-methyltransferase Ste14
MSPPARITALILGSLLYFPGMALTLWGRLALGRMYFVSTGMGAQLFADHRLVTRGPYAIVRHPMYLGITLAAIGGLFLYQTWTMVFFLLLPLGLIRRARIEEKVLEAEFGSQWSDYCRRVPALVPRLRICK